MNKSLLPQELDILRMDPHKQYLALKVNPVLEPMMTELLMQKPADPVAFIIAWLEKLRSQPGSKEMFKWK